MIDWEVLEKKLRENAAVGNSVRLTAEEAQWVTSALFDKGVVVMGKEVPCILPPTPKCGRPAGTRKTQ